MKIFNITIFYLTLLQAAADQLHYPELSGESLRLEMFFQFPSEQVTKLIVSGERLTMFLLTKLEQSLKTFNFLEFSDSFKNIVRFLRLFIVVVSLLFILFFFRPDPPEKKRLNAV